MANLQNAAAADGIDAPGMCNRCLSSAENSPHEP
jgi:hypothetical protein